MSTTLIRHINVAPKRLKAFSLSRIPSCGGYKNPVSAVIALYQGVYEQN
ncbi:MULTISPECIES: hypothetical protein [Bacteroides]|nr:MULTISPECIES: hypothetical protein [Bacteroides]MBU9950287.1 hypothetical protein [Bacteroides sp. MSK.20.12]